MMDQTAAQASRNLLIVADNRLDDPWGTGVPATLSGGSWCAERPLTNLLDPRFIVSAESTDATPASTQFVIDHGGQTDLRVCALIGTVSRAGRIRRVISRDGAAEPAEIVHDSGWVDWLPPSLPAWRLSHTHPSFGHGRPPERELRRAPYRRWHDVAPQAVLGRYEHVWIRDPDNADGHIRLRRAWTGAGWQTSVPVEYAAEWGWEDLSELRRLLSGRVDVDLHPRCRTMHVRIEGLPEDEALVHALDTVGQVGLSGQLYVAWDPTETAHMHRRAGIARLARLTPSQLVRHDWVDCGYQFIEEVA